ncbi:uncharacterized protein LOC107832086 isoform X3 [Nicotiana tabacum]|uniref:Uncharacterized protein LOC107832086 isoform X3 n=1 Tax=Nicotiana tabacum TaxID=4097 RepID=A0AC58SGS8_TOBAC|nr:uncharacterized protein LOC104118423 isoform X4 [Nicotiana tomentosiformis]
MPVAKLRIGGTSDAMKAEEVNDSLDTFIRHAMGKEPLLSFPRTGEGPVQWIQWLNSLDQPDITGWPFLTPSRVQMQKCEKCSREFFSPINHRRHILVHRRSLNLDKESRKYRDLLAAFWDKLSVDEVKEVVSLQDISLKVKAWVAEKDAEALRCQKLLFEEEEAAQKKQAELLERKKVKKLRQKEQKAKEQSIEEKGILEAPANIPDVSVGISTCLEMVQFSSNVDTSVESQYDLCHQHLDSVKVQNLEPRPVSANSRRRFANSQLQAPKSQRFGRNGGFHNNQNHQALKAEPIQKHKDSGTPVNSCMIWTRKVRVESDDTSILEVQKEDIDQKQRNSEVIIGSISVPVKDCSTQQQGRDDFGSTELRKKCNAVEKPAKHDALQIGSNRAAAKLWRPVRHTVGRQDPEEEGVMSSKFDDGTSLNENSLQSCPVDSSGSRKNCQVPDGNAHQGLGYSSIAAKAFLAQRWREAIAGDHVRLVLSPDTESSERPEVPSSSSEAAPASDSGEHGVVSRADTELTKNEVLTSSSSGSIKVKYRPKPEKGVKTMYIPKQKNHHLG